MQNGRVTRSRRVAVIGVLIALTAGACAAKSSSDTSGTTAKSGGGSTTTAKVVTSSRGYNGTTLLVAGIGGLTNFAGADLGAQARFKRANDTHELPYRIKYAEFADDKNDPATAISEVRRLVTQEKVFAIVPNFSAVNPGQYLNSQHVPYVGYAFDNTYCTQKPSTSIYGFGWGGCLVPENPPVLPDSYAPLYAYVSKKTGKKTPSIVLFSNDTASGARADMYAYSARGAGFDVVYAKGAVPETASDYTPYVQQWMTADHGKPPDAMYCLMAVQCIGVWAAVKAAGFTGTFQTSLYSDLLLKPLAGTVSSSQYNASPNPGLSKLEADLEAVKPGTKLSSLNAAAYFSADMFIQALKKVGTDVTPEAVQQALSNQTWQISGFAGPTKYPASSVATTPACSMLLLDADGTKWQPVVPYKCYTKQWPTH
jgi:ABC-type branched-subunit amino acid transport system substrate-binding protein